MTDSQRHPATIAILKHFGFIHLPPHLAAISERCHDLAFELADLLPDGPELTAGLRKLLEAKDCFVRAAAEQQRGAEEATSEPDPKITCGRCRQPFSEGPKSRYQKAGFCWSCVECCYESTDFAHECMICKPQPAATEEPTR